MTLVTTVQRKTIQVERIEICIVKKKYTAFVQLNKTYDLI